MKINNKLMRIVSAAIAALLCLIPAVAFADQTAELRIIKSASFGHDSGNIVAKSFTAIDGADVTYSINGDEKGKFDSSSFAVNISNADIGEKYEIVIVANASGYQQEVINVLYTVSAKDYAIMHNLTGHYIVYIEAQEGAVSHVFREAYADTSGGYFFFNTSSVTATLTANAPFMISGVSMDMGSASLIPGDSPIASIDFLEGVTGPSYIYTINVDVTIPDPDYDPNAKKTYIIRAAAGQGGRILLDGEVKVTQGTNPAFIMLPEDGYEVDCVYVDGVAKGAISHYAFWNISSGHDIVVTFIEISDAVSPDAVFSVPSAAPSIPRTGAGVSSAVFALLLSGLALIPSARKRAS